MNERPAFLPMGGRGVAIAVAWRSGHVVVAWEDVQVKRQKWYPRSRFATSALEEALAAFAGLLPKGTEMSLSELSITTGNTAWHYDSLAEFYAAHRDSHHSCHVFTSADSVKYQLQISEDGDRTYLMVDAPDRRAVAQVCSAFDRHAEEAKLPPPVTPKPTVFIGHGRSSQWRDLKDHLHDRQGYDVEAFETGSRAGHTIRSVLESMLDTSTFAVLVMTAEDVTADGELRARENVVHETGLFQGRLGFDRAIVLVEEGIEPFSNLQGIVQLRYNKGRIQEMFGEVLAVLRREFGT